MNVPQDILLNLTSNFSKLTWEQQQNSQAVANWCYSQHFTHNYIGIQLVLASALCMFIYDAIVDWKINIPDLVVKNKVIIDKALILDTLRFLYAWALYIFLFLFAYNAQNWHFLDGVLKLFGAL